MKEDLQEIKETLKKMQKDISRLEKLVADDFYNELTMDDLKARLKMAEDQLYELGYVYDPNIGIYGQHWPCHAFDEKLDKFAEKVSHMYDESINLISNYQNGIEQVPPLSKCNPYK